MEQGNHLSGRDCLILLWFAVITSVTITRPAIAQPATHDLSGKQAQKTQPDGQQRAPALLAHRGLVRHAPENTLSAFAAAVELGLSIELDVYQTSDKQLVVIHDKTVDRTTDGTGEVTKMTLAEIRQLDAGSWFHPSYAGLKVPTLEEAFQLIRKRQRKPVTIALNMKVISPGIEANIVKLVAKYDLFEQLFAFGQPEDSSRRFKQANPKLRITEVKIYDSEHFARALTNPLADCLWVGFIPSRDEMDQARALGKQVWLSLHIGDKSPDIWDKARASGMDGICTDWPLECRLHWRKQDTKPVTQISRP
jgi:glycerophosphoryl diester phosphodiesterase